VTTQLQLINIIIIIISTLEDEDNWSLRKVWLQLRSDTASYCGRTESSAIALSSHDGILLVKANSIQACQEIREGSLPCSQQPVTSTYLAGDIY